MGWHGTTLEELEGLLPFEGDTESTISTDSRFILFCGPFPNWSTRVPYEHEKIIEDFYNYRNNCIHIINTDINKINLLKHKIEPVIKYLFVLDELIWSLLSEDMLNGWELPYLLESKIDLDSGLYLSLNGYFKQAQIMLRSSLEDAVAHFYYSFQKINYDNLMANKNFRIPTFRMGPNNMLSSLLNTKYINIYLFNLLNKCYGNLNRFVHSNITELTINMPWDEDQTDIKIERWVKNACDTSHCLILLILSMLKNNI